MAVIPTGEGMNVIISGEDRFTPTAKKVQAEAAKTGEAFKRMKDEGEKVSKTHNDLSEKLTTFNQRVLVNRIGITALTFAFIRFIQTSQEAAEKSDRLKDSLHQTNVVLDQSRKSWKEFTENFGASILNFRAAEIEQRAWVKTYEQVEISLKKQNQLSKDNITITREMIKQQTGLIMKGKELETQRIYELKFLEDINKATKLQTESIQHHTKEILESSKVKQQLIAVENRFGESVNKVTEKMSKQEIEIFKSSELYKALQNDANAMADTIKNNTVVAFQELIHTLELQTASFIQASEGEKAMYAQTQALNKILKDLQDSGKFTGEQLRIMVQALVDLNNAASKITAKEVSDVTGKTFYESGRGERVEKKSDFVQNPTTGKYEIASTS